MNLYSWFKKKPQKTTTRKRFNLSKSYLGGNLETLEIEPCGLLRILGCSQGGFPSSLRVLVNGNALKLLKQYWVYRAKRDLKFETPEIFSGFAMEYLYVPQGDDVLSSLQLLLDNETIFQLNERRVIRVPHYEHLFSEERVFHRNNIYGYGPPAKVVGREVLALSKLLSDPIIDFGCGIGALVKELRFLGKEAVGIEIDRPEINSGLFDEVRPFITLHDGNFPLPFKDKAFESGLCVEVLEHIADFEGAVSELARIIRKRLIITVPDISAIPLLHQHNVVPWHLLESTHVNFFTQHSLSKILKDHFDKVEFARIGSVKINGTQLYTSLVALCDV